MNLALAGRDPRLVRRFAAIQRLELKEKCERSLYEFIKSLWHVVEPGREFVEGWHIEAICEHLEAVTSGQIRRLLITVPPGSSKSLCTDVFYPAWEWGPADLPAMRYIAASYSDTLTIRDNRRFRHLVESELYQDLWGDRWRPAVDQWGKEKLENDHRGWKLATSVEGVATGERSDKFLIDDAHNIIEAESEAVRASTLQWFNEVVPTRMNDPDKSAIIIIMQRVHEDDIAGAAISTDRGYVHLMLPLRYDPRRHCSTAIGFEDPRGFDEYDNAIYETNPDACVGRLLDPIRFPEHVVAKLERELGPYACTPYESPVLMTDLSLKPIGEIEAGDTVIGFTTDVDYDDEGRSMKRRHLVKSIVKNIHRATAPVVRMTLDTGRTIRCTADHKWYVGKRGGRRGRNDVRPLYKPAKVGSWLCRVCETEFPELSIEQTRIAGWLAGFYDGEGSVSLCDPQKKSPTGQRYRPSATITFWQGGGRNRPICDRVEESLSALGFSFGRSLIMRPERNGGKFPYHCYRLLAGHSDLIVKQKFLQMVDPTKWRDRIAEGALGAKFIAGFERVERIEPDGTEDVFALETETGNYVVWGFASSNSAAQFDQSPAPRGGGIFKADWWKLYPGDVPGAVQEEFDEKGNPIRRVPYPPMEFILLSLDTAYTVKEENDWNACTVWGTWRDSGNVSRLLLMEAWHARLHFRDLVDKVMDTGRRHRVDYIMIEAKSAGMPVAQEIARLCMDGEWSVMPVNPKGDKVSRAHATVPLFAGGIIYAPDRAWADMVIAECMNFPRGKHDDLVDSVTQALVYMRRHGMARLEEESMSQIRHDLMWDEPDQEPLYDV